jgi:hypothetical protein
MTRDERLAQKEANDKKRLEDTRKKLAGTQAQRREIHRKDVNKRRYRVGAIADDAGLLAWSDADLSAVFAVLARLTDVAHPAAVLEGLLADGCSTPGRSVNGFACQDGSVSATH